jgi:hypothetical protein
MNSSHDKGTAQTVDELTILRLENKRVLEENVALKARNDQAEKVIAGLGGFIKSMCVALSPPGFRPELVGGTYVDVLRHLIEKQLGLAEGALK